MCGRLTLAERKWAARRVPNAEDVKRAVTECTQRVNQAGKRVREQFMKYAWVNDVLRAGFRTLIDGKAAHSA